MRIPWLENWRSPTTWAQSWSRSPSGWPSSLGTRPTVSCSIPIAAVSASGEFAKPARDHYVVRSVGRKGECWDKAVAEPFFATIKRELIETRAWPTRAGLLRAVFEYIEDW